MIFASVRRIFTRFSVRFSVRFAFFFALMLLAVSAGTLHAQDAAPTVSPTLIPTPEPPPVTDPSDARCGVTDQNTTRVVLTCEPGFASARDQVTILARPIDPSWVYPTTPAEPLPSILSGYWVFDAGADGTVNLIIEFSQGANGEAIADFYSDLNGDGQVNLIPPRDNGLIGIVEAPSIRMVAPDGWWVDDDLVNYNLDITVDGRIRASFGVSLVFGSRQWLEATTDGTPEYEIHVRDIDYDGRPDYEWRQLLLDIPESDAFFRTEVVYNTQDDEGVIEDYLFWQYLTPFMGDVNAYPKLVYGMSSPPIHVDWASSTVPLIGEFVASRANAGNYFIYTLDRLKENELSIASFESPFAFYNVTGIQPEMPDLLIRAAYTPLNSLYFTDGDTNPESRNDTAFQEMYYAWRYPTPQDPARGPVWDFSLSIAGRHEYDSVVTIPPFDIILPPYETLPDWVIDRAWDFASLNANEGGGQPDSEAIPRWSVLEGASPLANLYITGLIGESPFVRRFTNVDTGMRAEMAPALQQQLGLYIDSFDTKLHLQKAAFGVWRRNALGTLQYRNLNDDPYIDQWSYVEGGNVRQQITRAGDFLLLEDRTTVRVAYHPVEPSLAEGLPPTDGDELRAWHDRIEAANSGFQPHEMAVRFGELNAPTWTVTEAELLDLHFAGNGFEAVLALSPGSDADGNLPIDITADPSELMTLFGTGDRLILSPVDPPTVTIDSINIGLGSETRTLFERQRVEIQLRNESLIRVDDAQVRVTARQGSTLVPLLDNPIDLPGRAITPISVIWQPLDTGDWQINVEVDVRWNEESVTLRDSEQVNITSESLDNRHLLDLWGQQPLSGALQVTLLISGMLIGASLIVLLYRRMNQS